MASLTLAASSQQSSSSSDSSGSTQQQGSANPALRPRAAQIEQGGAAVTLEVQEPLFDVAAALNACGYDADLARSAPVRAEVRADMNAALQASEPARASRDALCGYIHLHQLNDAGLNVGQYVSLALYLSPPPSLTPNLDESQLPPQAAQVVNVLPLLRTFAADVDLHYIWVHHRAEYEALQARVHDPMVHAILSTNIYLHQPVSTYDGRRFLVLLEPMLSPALTNARVYGADYIVVLSPDNTPASTTSLGSTDASQAGPLQAGSSPVDANEIRHIYLHYVVEPMVYSRGTAMERIQPILRGVQDAPLEFFYKSDAPALLTECLIKAIEAHLYVIDGGAPARPRSKLRADLDQYAALKDLYDRQNALARLKLVDADEAQGWVLTGYFYNALAQMERTGDGLRDEIAQMIYGMDVQRELGHAEGIVFVKFVPADPLRPNVAPRKISPLDIAEVDLAKGDIPSAGELADQAMADPASDHGRAQYILARIDLMQGHAADAKEGFEKTLLASKDPRTLAWSHIYIGRLYDAHNERSLALEQYKEALVVRDAAPDTRQAADAGIAKPFALPLRPGQQQPATDEDDKNFDPTGKAEKDSYKPPQ